MSGRNLSQIVIGSEVRTEKQIIHCLEKPFPSCQTISYTGWKQRKLANQKKYFRFVCPKRTN